MVSLNFDTQTLVLILTTLLTGLSAGLYFTWGNAVTPGLGQLDDLSYLRSFQEMNRAIINPAFMVVFFGPIFLHISNVLLFRTASSTIIWMLIASAALYIIGVIIVTVFGNVPINDTLDKTDLAIAGIDELRTLRDRFEIEWNRLNLIRTMSSILSFLLLVLVCLGKNNTINP